MSDEYADRTSLIMAGTVMLFAIIGLSFMVAIVFWAVDGGYCNDECQLDRRQQALIECVADETFTRDECIVLMQGLFDNSD